MDTVARGNVAEAAVALALLEAGMVPFLPLGGGAAVDLVALHGDRTVRIQVKSGRVRQGCIRFNTCGTDHGRGRRDYRGRAEVIAVHVAEMRAVFVVSVEDCPGFAGVLRLAPPRNGQRTGVRLAADHTFERWAASL